MKTLMLATTIMLGLVTALANSASAQPLPRYEQDYLSAKDIIGVWRSGDKTLNFYGDGTVIYDRTLRAGAMTAYEKGKGRWSVIGESIRLEYLLQREIVYDGPTPMAKQGTVRMVEDFEVLPPRTLRKNDGTVYTKQS
jgi:hypothetical protein